MANANQQIQMGLMALMGCLGLGLMINAVVNPTKDNKDAVMKTAQAPIAPGARR
jgi:hypothetical protein